MNIKVFPNPKRQVQDSRKTCAAILVHGWQLDRSDAAYATTIDAWHPDNVNWTLTVLYAVDPNGRWVRRIEVKWWAWDCPDADGNPTVERRCLPLGVDIEDVLPLVGDDVTFADLWAACDGTKAA